MSLRRVVAASLFGLLCAVAVPVPGHAQQRADEIEQRREALRERWRDAGPEERRHIRQRVLEHWASVSPEEQSGLRAARDPQERGERWRRELRDTTSPAERRRIRRYLQGLDAAERRALRERVERYRALDAPARRALRRALEDFRALPAERQKRFRDNARRWKQLSPEAQQRMREQLARLRQMDPQERLRLLERVLPPE